MADSISAGIGQKSVATTPGSFVTVGAASTSVASANGARAQITICNDHATQIVYLSLGGTAVVGSGVRLNAAGGSYTTTAYSGAIAAIATGASTNVTVTEI